MDYIYYLHEPYENEYLLMSVYPYEVGLKYIDANNNNGIAGGGIQYRKEIVRKIAGKGCQDTTIHSFTRCIRKKLKTSLENANLTCTGM